MAAGALEEFARMPTQRKVMTFAIIGLLGLLLYWKLVSKSLDEEIEAADADHSGKVSTNRRLAEDIPKFEELRAHKAKLDELIRKNQTALPQEADLPQFFETLQRKVAESGSAIRKWTNKPGEPVESFVKIPVEIELSGTFMQLKRFFASLVQSDIRAQGGEPGVDEPERIVSIENLQISSPTVVNREIVLNAKFTAVTFRQADRPAAPTPPPGAARPAPAPAATSPSGGPPPLPSASTPAGAKARVEDSLDKGDARNRNATGVPEAKTPAAGSGSGSARLKGGL